MHYRRQLLPNIVLRTKFNASRTIVLLKLPAKLCCVIPVKEKNVIIIFATISPPFSFNQTIVYLMLLQYQKIFEYSSFDVSILYHVGTSSRSLTQLVTCGQFSNQRLRDLLLVLLLCQLQVLALRVLSPFLELDHEVLLFKIVFLAKWPILFTLTASSASYFAFVGMLAHSTSRLHSLRVKHMHA